MTSLALQRHSRCRSSGEDTITVIVASVGGLAEESSHGVHDQKSGSILVLPLVVSYH